MALCLVRSISLPTREEEDSESDSALKFGIEYSSRLDGVIGSGQFGTVHKGLWQISPGNVLECAVKTLHEGASEDDELKFLQEAAINGQFHHPNIVQLLGVVTLNKPVSRLYLSSSISVA